MGSGAECWYKVGTMPCSSATSPQPVCAPGPASTWAVVPVKRLDRAKQRLQECLGEQRRGFTLAMLEDVLRAVTDSRRVGRVLCVSDDEAVARLALRHGAEVLADAGAGGMNAAVHRGLEAARQRGARRVVVLPADLPLATGAAIDGLLEQLDSGTPPGDPPRIALGADAEGCGTNVLVLDTEGEFTFRYGPGSFRRHREQARAAGGEPLQLVDSRLALDIDCERDLRELLSYWRRHPEPRESRTREFLRRCGWLNDTAEHRQETH